MYELKEDRSLDLIKDDEFPGFLIAHIEILKNLEYQPIY